jgi:hypothetical protein
LIAAHLQSVIVPQALEAAEQLVLLLLQAVEDPAGALQERCRPVERQ